MTDTETANHQEPTATTGNGSIESRARRMGWKPEDEWQGEPPKDGFRTAAEFVEHGDTELPVLRERNRKLGEDLAETNERLTAMSSTMDEFRTYHEKTEERAYLRAKKDLQQKQRTAVKEGDDEAFDAAAKEIDELDQDAAKARAAPEKKVEPADDPVFKQWEGDNSWYGDDMELTAYADTIAPHVARKTKATGRPYYDAIRGEVEKRFPDHFDNPNRRQAPAVESGGRMPGGSRQTGKTYANLPAEAKAACDEFVGQKLLTRQQYVDEYDWSDA